jgi:hypothetical protein
MKAEIALGAVEAVAGVGVVTTSVQTQRKT